MPAPHHLDRDQLLLGIALLLLGVLALYLVTVDLSHRPPGHSRIDWPTPPPAGP